MAEFIEKEEFEFDLDIRGTGFKDVFLHPIKGDDQSYVLTIAYDCHTKQIFEDDQELVTRFFCNISNGSMSYTDFAEEWYSLLEPMVKFTPRKCVLQISDLNDNIAVLVKPTFDMQNNKLCITVTYA